MEHASHTSESDHEVEQEFDEEDEDVVSSFLLRIFFNEKNIFV